MTFDHDVQVPGAVLPAGTYLFTQTSPTTMRVTNEVELEGLDVPEFGMLAYPEEEGIPA